MILYIQLEIPMRELSGQLLLAVIAAARGHQVLIASPNDLALYRRFHLLRPGCYMVKNVNVPSSSDMIYRDYIKDGCDIYCHEQEASILWGDFAKFLSDYNINRAQPLPFKGVFCWGQRDATEYKTFFGERGRVFYNTGSPRADLWGETFAKLRRNADVTALGPFVLVATNFAWLMGKKHMSQTFTDQQSLELLESYDREKALYAFVEEDYTIALRMIVGIKYLANQYRGLKIAVRPHPLDNVSYWRNLFRNNPNVIVTGNRDSITPWIAGASAVVQNGCTSAVEAVLQGIPVISYGPDRHQSDLSIPNRLGLRARTLEELKTTAECVLAGKYHVEERGRSRDVLRPLVTTEENNAAVAILSIIECKSKRLAEYEMTAADVSRLRIVRGSKNMADHLRRKLGRLEEPKGKHDLDQRETERYITRLCDLLRIPVPEVRWISCSGILMLPNTARRGEGNMARNDYYMNSNSTIHDAPVGSSAESHGVSQTEGE